MNQHVPLATHVAIFRRVREQIAADAGLAEDDDAVLDTAEGETDLAEFLANLIRESRRADTFAQGMVDIIKTEQARKARFEQKSSRLRSIVMHAMIDAGLAKLAMPDFTASRSRAQAKVEIPDEASVPDDFCRIRREPDRTKIKQAIKDGADLSFAYLGNAAEVLTVRST